jgi:NAD(P)-dependent dehydrogenase (short-subunit alcohol dehydrogenase family)
MNLFDLTGEIAVVLGATGVLGGALAEGLAAAGAKVAVTQNEVKRGFVRFNKVEAQPDFFPPMRWIKPR